MITVKKFSDKDKLTGCSLNAQSTATSEHSLVKDAVSYIEELRMSYQQDSHASHSQLPESKRENVMTEICGLKQSSVFAEYDHDTHSWRMSQVSLLTNTLDEFSETWPKVGMMQGGVCWELMMWGLPIGESGCGFWLTPSTIQISGGENRVEKRTEYRNSIGRQYVPGSLAEQIMWPTPNTRDYKDGSAESCKNVPINSLLGRAVHWRTPNQTDWKNRGTEEYREGRQIQLQTQVQGQLNPDWVEWLMGWPICWTSLEPIEELMWLDWSVDPADMLPPDEIGTPRATEAIRSERFRVGRIPSPEEYVKQWPTPRAGNPGSRPNMKGGKILAEEVKKNEITGLIPRIATGIKDRVNRLKAIGNGQVPRCVTTAWRILTKTP